MKKMNTDVAYIFVLIIFTSNTYWSFQENVRKNQNKKHRSPPLPRNCYVKGVSSTPRHGGEKTEVQLTDDLCRNAVNLS
jgi:hypothetical protein